MVVGSFFEPQLSSYSTVYVALYEPTAHFSNIASYFYYTKVHFIF